MMYGILLILVLPIGLPVGRRLGYPDYTSIWTLITAQSDDKSTLIVNHSLGEVPGLVEVLVTPTDGPYKGFLFKATGDGERDDDISEKYGGVVYIYNDVSVAVTSPKRHNHFDSGYAIFTGYNSHWKGGSSFSSRSAYVKVRCWLPSNIPQPCYENIDINVESGSNSKHPTFIEVNHGAGKLPDMVIVRTKMTNGQRAGWFSDAQGTNRFIGSGNGMHGGIKFGFNSNSVRVWIPSKNGAGNHIFAATDGWGLKALSTAGILDIRVWCDLHNSVYADNNIDIGPNVINEQSSWNLSTQDTSTTYMDVFAIVTVQAQGGQNDGYVFNGIDGAMTHTTNDVDPCRYGGVIYNYNTQSVNVRRPVQSQGAIVCIDDDSGDGMYTGATANGVFSAKMLKLELPPSNLFSYKYTLYEKDSGTEYPDIGTTATTTSKLCLYECNKRSLCKAVKYVAAHNVCTMFDTLLTGNVFSEIGSNIWQICK